MITVRGVIACIMLTAGLFIASAPAAVLVPLPAGVADPPPLVGMPNPAAVYAHDMGYGYEIRTDENGNQYGVVILPDGTERDEWELYRETHPSDGGDPGPMDPIGMPNPAAAYAEEMGYGYEIRTDEQGNQYGVVILPDGTERDEWELYYETHPQNPENPDEPGPDELGDYAEIQNPNYQDHPSGQDESGLIDTAGPVTARELLLSMIQDGSGPWNSGGINGNWRTGGWTGHTNVIGSFSSVTSLVIRLNNAGRAY